MQFEHHNGCKHYYQYIQFECSEEHVSVVGIYSARYELTLNDQDIRNILELSFKNPSLPQWSETHPSSAVRPTNPWFSLLACDVRNVFRASSSASSTFI